MPAVMKHTVVMDEIIKTLRDAIDTEMANPYWNGLSPISAVVTYKTELGATFKFVLSVDFDE